MRRINPRSVHPLACSCRSCSPQAATHRRVDRAIKAATRVLILIAVIVAVPFIVAHALASATSDHR